MSKKKICIVDDEPMIVEMYKIKLEEEGYEVVSAGDGLAGFSIIKKEKPDLALIDIVMPNEDGLSLMRRIKNDSEISATPIIVLTNLDDAQTRKTACQLGALFYLVKPHFMPSQLAKIVKEILGFNLKYPEFLACNKACEPVE